MDPGKLSVLDRHNRKVTLREEQLLPRTRCCLLCGSAELRIAGNLQRKPEVNLVECLRCRVISAGRMPRDEILQQYYSDYYAHDEIRITSYAAGVATHIFRRTLGLFTRGAAALRILDFGGGDGAVAIALGRKFVRAGLAPRIEVTLVDYNARDREVPAEVAFDWHRRLEDLPAPDRFDIIIANGVLEHIPQANQALAALLLRLNTAGIFYARTPFMIAFHRIFSFLHLPSPIPFPGHLHDMGREYWNRVLTILNPGSGFRMLASNSACVETSLLSARWPMAAISHLLKAPSRVAFLRNHYDFVGGWEVLIQREAGLALRLAAKSVRKAG
jgi:SAM-dependent methyltransferase